LPDGGDETTFMKLLNDIDVPPVDPAREAALLAAFDEYHARRRQRFRFPAWAAAAALVVITVSLNWLVVTRPAPAEPRAADASFDLTGFVAWPGASAWPPLESGSLMRVDLPVSLLPTLGLSAPSSAGFVAADIVVGQDGFARAVRLVQQQ
jgi:hypothetical protein